MESWIGIGLQVLVILAAVGGAYTLLKVRISVLETRVDALEDDLDNIGKKLDIINSKLDLLTSSSIRISTLLKMKRAEDYDE